MPKFRLTETAAAKLRVILRDSELKFGRHQTDIYHAGFIKTFELLSHFPGIARSADPLRKGYRRHHYESHVIFFTADDDEIVIRDLFHTAQNITKDMLA
jgi:plasmid stabilization system protein ParE